jgi:hypothetical protein
MTRRTLALGIIGLWVLGLGFLYRRSSFRTPEQSLAEAGMRVSPATYYYRVEQAGAQIGAASSALDTTTTQLIATDFIRAAIPANRDTFRMQARVESRYTRALSLRDFIMKVEGDVPAFLLRGVLQGEGKSRTLELTTEIPKSRPRKQQYDVSGLIFTPTVAPLPLMLGKAHKTGSRSSVSVFDPISQTVRKVVLLIEKDSLFRLADSAVVDSATKRWRPAHEDTVRGWRVSGDVPAEISWVDESGRLIAAYEPGGISISRTAFEIAFENWRLETVAVSDSLARAQRARQRSPARRRK